jgi:hypothetical protein
MIVKNIFFWRKTLHVDVTHRFCTPGSWRGSIPPPGWWPRCSRQSADAADVSTEPAVQFLLRFSADTEAHS